MFYLSSHIFFILFKLHDYLNFNIKFLVCYLDLTFCSLQYAWMKRLVQWFTFFLSSLSHHLMREARSEKQQITILIYYTCSWCVLDL